MSERLEYVALSVKQPWANMIAEGKKRIETRTWETRYRGRLLIVASQRPAVVERITYPTGCALALVQLVTCRPMTIDDEPGACCHIYRGAWAWVLADIRPVTPFPVKGKLGLYRVTLDRPLEFAEEPHAHL